MNFDDLDCPIIVFYYGLFGHRKSPYVQDFLKLIRNKCWRAIFIHRKGFNREMLQDFHIFEEKEFDHLRHQLEYIANRYKNLNLYILAISAGNIYSINSLKNSY